MNASTKTAALGWELFKAHEFKQPDEETLAEINAGLPEPIHMRTLKHYHNMFMAGHEGEYVPINRWDVLRST